jgi:hypothetical protein
MTVDRHRVAVHEADHAVAYHLAGIPFRYITLRPPGPARQSPWRLSVYTDCGRSATVTRLSLQTRTEPA